MTQPGHEFSIRPGRIDTTRS
ncbi:hypothetical protein BsWGS_28907 [Bradybaena similaris]